MRADARSKLFPCKTKCPEVSVVREEDEVRIAHINNGPADFAHAVEFLADRRSGWITGAALPVDGGWLAADTPAIPTP